MNGTDNRSAVSLTCRIHRGVEDCEQGVVLLVFSQLSSLVSLDSSTIGTEVIYKRSKIFTLSFRSLFCLRSLSNLCLGFFTGFSYIRGSELTVDL